MNGQILSPTIVSTTSLAKTSTTTSDNDEIQIIEPSSKKKINFDLVLASNKSKLMINLTKFLNAFLSVCWLNFSSTCHFSYMFLLALLGHFALNYYYKFYCCLLYLSFFVIASKTYIWTFCSSVPSKSVPLMKSSPSLLLHSKPNSTISILKPNFLSAKPQSAVKVHLFNL